MTPYDFKFYDTAHIINGIACGPQDDELPHQMHKLLIAV